MRIWFALLVATVVLVAPAASAASDPPRTQIVRWSPFDSAGRVKAEFEVETREGACVDVGYSLIGGIGYRCGSGNVGTSLCWRDGPNPTDYAICVYGPWDTTVVRVHAPRLLLYPGVTWSEPDAFPFALELADGNRCRGYLTGTSNIPTPRGPRRADFGCSRGGIELADLRRGRRLWRVSAVRWSSKDGYSRPRYVTIRRAFVGVLPRPMARQDRLAQRAVAAAETVIRKT